MESPDPFFGNRQRHHPRRKVSGSVDSPDGVSPEHPLDCLARDALSYGCSWTRVFLTARSGMAYVFRIGL